MIFSILIFFIFLISGIVISVQDIRTFHLPLSVIYSAAALILIFRFCYEVNAGILFAAGGISAFLFYSFIRMITAGALGMGDVHLAFLCGCYNGIYDFFLSSFLSALTGSLFFLFQRIFFRKSIRNLRLPIAPFMTVSSLFIELFRIVKIPEVLWQ